MCAFVFPCSRFDTEQNQAQAEVQRERSQREKLAREKDMFAGEMFNLRQQLQVSPFAAPLPPTCDPTTLHLTNPGWVQMPSFSVPLPPAG